jgi:hypothetical protein
MQLVRHIEDLKDLPDFYIFYCVRCRHVEAVRQERAGEQSDGRVLEEKRCGDKSNCFGNSCAVLRTEPKQSSGRTTISRKTNSDHRSCGTRRAD